MTVEVKLNESAVAVLKSSEELSNRDVKELRRAARKVGLVGQKLEALGLDELRQEADDDADEETKKARNAKALSILSSLDDSEDDSLDLFQRVATVVRLESWTLDRPLPETPEDVDDLPRPVYAALTKAAADLDLSEDFSVDGAENPTAPTES